MRYHRMRDEQSTYYDARQGPEIEIMDAPGLYGVCKASSSATPTFGKKGHQRYPDGKLSNPYRKLHGKQWVSKDICNASAAC